MSLSKIPIRVPIPAFGTAALAAAVALLLSGVLASTAHAAGGVPRPDHIVVVVMENHSNTEVIGSSSAPYINSLAATGANFSQSYAITHPSEPNYLALFSGSTQGVTDDSCPHTFSGANLGSELIANGLTFAGYSESMPYDGYTGCSSGSYARKHNPWVNFTNVPASANLTMDAFPSDYSQLPTVSVVVPNQDNDMHDGTVAQGDSWLQQHLDGYVQWAKTHNSLMVLTFDEDDNSAGNRIPTVFVGASVTPGLYSETIDHYDVLRTLEDAYELPYAGASASATPISDVWSTTLPPPPPPPTGCTAAQLIVNPGFETGSAAPWTGSTDVVVHETADQLAWGGNYMALLDGQGVAHTDTLSQTVTIPATCSAATLSFYLHIGTAQQTKRFAYDTLKVMLQSPVDGSVLDTLDTYSNLDAATGYQRHTFDVSAYAGTPLMVTFSGTENASRQTSFVVDRVTLPVS